VVAGRRQENDRQAWIFTAVVSRHRFVWPVLRETTASAIEACEAAWEFFGGIFGVLLPEGCLRGGTFPIIEPRLAPLPFLRLFILDAAIRWAALQALRVSEGAEPNLRPPALETDGFAPIPAHEFAPVMAEVIEYGARATMRDRLCGYLAECSARHAEVQADFLALPGLWDRRITYWAKMMTAFDARGGFLNHLPGLSEEQKQGLRPEIEDRSLRMRFFDTEPAAHPHLFQAPEDANTRAKREVIQGHRAYSYGNTRKAADHLREGLKHDPNSASYNYGLGAYLGELVMAGHLDCLDEALSACRKAARLDPTWNSPPTEIAIIYSNVGMLDEALKAFSEAEGVAQGWSHFHYTRGNTLLWAGRGRTVRGSSYILPASPEDRAGEARPDGEHGGRTDMPGKTWRGREAGPGHRSPRWTALHSSRTVACPLPAHDRSRDPASWWSPPPRRFSARSAPGFRRTQARAQ
jgi:tetratricopeptide (TPR) repeat protein